MTLDLDVKNQKGEPVMTMSLANLVQLRDPAAPIDTGGPA